MASGRRLVLGISGGIAAYKTPSLIRLFQKKGFDVKTVCTPAGRMLVAQQALFTITGHPVYIDEPLLHSDMDHIELAKWGEYLLICPATANTLAKIAHGIADNLLCSLALSFQGRLAVAPAMNTAMWNNEATQDNIALLHRRNVRVLPVDEGELACGDEGAGRLLPLESIVDYMLSFDAPQLLANKNMLIASGPTYEPLDAVRVLTGKWAPRSLPRPCFPAPTSRSSAAPRPRPCRPEFVSCASPPRLRCRRPWKRNFPAPIFASWPPQ